MDKNPLIRKGLAVGIILLFIGTNVIPSTAHIIEKPSLPASRDNWLYVGGSGPGNYTLIQDVIDNASDNNTVTITLKSGQYDMNTSTFRGILGYTFLIENRGTKEIWCDVIADHYAFFSHQHIAYSKISSNLWPQWAWFVGTIPVLYLHPLMTITVRVTTNTSTNLTLERSGIELFSSFFIGWTGPESVTGPS